MNLSRFDKPVLFIIFNRPENTQRVFEKIKKAGPERLYVAADGPRINKQEDKELCEKTRAVVDQIDWDCEVSKLYRDVNLGCGRAVSEAITWFFKQEREGIILEDDCLPSSSFFSFCSELLDYYRENKKVMHISGDQLISGFDNGASYYFAKIQHCWGWASWADRWQYYDFKLKDYNIKNIRKFSENKRVQAYWKNILKYILKKLKKKEIDIWDPQWTFKIIECDGLCINPAKNLVSNIGFGENSTHTNETDYPFANLPVYEIGYMVHCNKVEIDNKAVVLIYRKVYNAYNFKDDLIYKRILNLLKKIKRIMLERQ